jgi:hypothetical protein
MKRKIGLTIAAMLLAAQLGAPLDAAEPSLEQLYAIAAILEQNDVAALRSFVEGNPEVLEGDGQLAILLRRFMVASRDLNAYLSSGGGMNNLLSDFAQITSEVTIEEGSDPGDPDEDPEPAPDPEPDTAPDPEPTPDLEPAPEPDDGGDDDRDDDDGDDGIY